MGAEYLAKLSKPEDLEKQILQELGNGEKDTIKQYNRSTENEIFNNLRLIKDDENKAPSPGPSPARGEGCYFYFPLS